MNVRAHPMNYARRQQYRRLVHAAVAVVVSLAATLLALALGSAGATSLAAVFAITAIGFGFYARRWLGLARRSRVGARSEDEVRHELAALAEEGWRLRHSLRWRGRGDIDSLAIAPSGIAFAIETKTRTYDGRHLALVREQAGWLARGRRGWCHRNALPVLCVVRARSVRRWQAGVLVVSIDRLTPALQSEADRKDLGGSVLVG
jgi:hypothetical protein